MYCIGIINSLTSGSKSEDGRGTARVEEATGRGEALRPPQ